MEFSAESIQKINGLTMAVLNKQASELTHPELQKIVAMDMMSLPDELTVNTNDTRSTERQYNTNVYGGSIKVDLRGIKELIRKTALEHEDPNEVLNSYLEDKKSFIQMIKFKYASMESTLRELSREAQMKDKVIGVGRYSTGG